MIPFNKSPVTGYEVGYLHQALSSKKMSGDGPFGKQCQRELNLKATTDKQEAFAGAEYVVIATPTDYDPATPVKEGIANFAKWFEEYYP